MPDNKLTDNEIIKALEETIELRFDGESEYATVRLDTLTNALDLINRLETKVIKEQNKNSKLRNERNHLQADKEYYKKNRDRYQDGVMFLSKQCDELQAENGRLYIALEEVKKEVKKLMVTTDKIITEAKAEAYKECIEKMKEKSCKLNMCDNDIVVKTDYQISGEALDNLLLLLEKNLKINDYELEKV